MHEIDKIDEKSEENDIRLNLYIKKNPPVYFIFKSEEKRKEFKNDLSYFKHLYKKFLNYFYPSATIELKKPIHFHWMLKQELEYKNWKNMKLDHLDMKYLLKDKKMEKLFEQNSIESLKNRFLCNFLTINVTKRTPNAIKSIEKEGKAGFFDQAFEKLDFGLKSLVMLIGDIPILSSDEKLLTIDNLVLENQNLPDWMDFYTIYVFNDFEGIGDVKTYDHAFDLRTIKQIFARPDEKSFVIELTKQFVEISTGDYWKLYNWYKAVSISQEHGLEIQRSSNKGIKMNVHVLLRHSLFNRTKMIQKEIEKMLADVSPKLKFGMFQKRLAETFLKIDFMFDAFYSKVVVNYSLIKACMISIHILIVKRMKKFWVYNRDKLGPYENLNFASLAVTYKEIVTSWGLIENELECFVKPTIVNFIGSTFQNIKKVIAGILSRAESEYEMVGDKIYSPGADSIVNLCAETFEHYTSVPCEEACKYLLTIISRMLSIYERFMIDVIDTEEAEEMLAGHMNGLGLFLIRFRGLIKTIVKKTNNKFSYKTICEWINDYKFIKSMTRLMVVIENRLLIKLKVSLEKGMYKSKKFLKFNLKTYLEKFFAEFQFVFNKIERGNLERLCAKVLSTVTKMYIEMAISDLSIYKEGYLRMTLQKIKNDINTMQLIFDNYLERDEMDKPLKRLSSLCHVWEEEDFNLFQMHYVNLATLMKTSKAITDIKLLKNVFKIRDCFNSDTKKFIIEDIENILNTLIRKGEDKGDAFYQAIKKQRIQINVQKFIYNLRKAVEERKNKDKKRVGSTSKIDISMGIDMESSMLGDNIHFSMISFKQEKNKDIPRGKATMIRFNWKIKWSDLKSQDLDLKLIKFMKKRQTNAANISFIYWQVKEFGLELSSDSNYKTIVHTMLFSDIDLIRALDQFTLAVKCNTSVMIFKLQEKIKKSSKGFYRVMKKFKKKSTADNIKFRVKKFEMNINFGLSSLKAKKVDLSFDFEKIKFQMQNEKKKKSKRRKSIHIDI